MMLKVLNWLLIMSPSDQFMAAYVVVVVMFLFLFYFLAQVGAKNRTLVLFYGVLNLSILSWVLLGVAETDAFVLCCGY